MHKWGVGNSSAVEVLRSARTYVRGSGGRLVKDKIIMRLAGYRTFEKNAERLLEAMVPEDMLPPILSVGEDSEIDTLLLPEESFHWLRKLDYKKFERHLGAYVGGMEAWWTALYARSDGPEL